jgi:hypothetical protein
MLLLLELMWNYVFIPFEGHCFGCENEGVDDLRHPACKSAYVGGHEDRGFPFMENSETEVLQFQMKFSSSILPLYCHHLICSILQDDSDWRAEEIDEITEVSVLECSFSASRKSSHIINYSLFLVDVLKLVKFCILRICSKLLIMHMFSLNLRNLALSIVIAIVWSGFQKPDMFCPIFGIRGSVLLLKFSKFRIIVVSIVGLDSYRSVKGLNSFKTKIAMKPAFFLVPVLLIPGSNTTKCFHFLGYLCRYDI